MCFNTELTSFEPGAISAAREGLIRCLLDCTGDDHACMIYESALKRSLRLHRDFAAFREL